MEQRSQISCSSVSQIAAANDERDFDVLPLEQVRGEDLNINAQACGECGE
jgi:hypothetical protein